MLRSILAAAVATGGLALAGPAPGSAEVAIGVGTAGYMPVWHRGYAHHGHYGHRRAYRPPVRVYVAPRGYYAAPRYRGGDGCETVKVRVWNGYGYETHKRRRCY